MPLFNFALISLIVFNTTLDGAFFAMGLPASEWTAKVCTAGIAGVGNKIYLAVFTFGQAIFQMRFGF